MRVLYFVHTCNEKNGIAAHVQNLSGSLPADVRFQVIGGKGASLPLFSSLRFPIGEFFAALRADFDIIHVHGYGNFYSFFGAIISILRRKPLVWTIHGYPRIKGARRLFYLAYRYLMAPPIFWRAKRIISVSGDILPLLAKETKKPITVLPNGVDLGLFRPSSGYKSAKHACFVGRLDPDKGAARLLECSSLPLLFIGPDEAGTRKQIAAEAKRLGRKAEFSECGYNGMPSQYERCRYVVLPSKYEGFPLTMLESIAMGRPFISNDVGEVKATLSSLFSNPSRYLLSGDVGKKIAELEKSDLTSELREARIKAAKYSWGSVAKKTAAIYFEIA